VRGGALNRVEGRGPWRACIGQCDPPHPNQTRDRTRVRLEVGDEPDRRGPPGGERGREERGVGLGCWARKGGAECQTRGHGTRYMT
jgi:hypothetical protein